MHDTLKKPRELLAFSYSLRFPDLAVRSKHPGGEVDLDHVDQAVRLLLVTWTMAAAPFLSLEDVDRPVRRF